MQKSFILFKLFVYKHFFTLDLYIQNYKQFKAQFRALFEIEESIIYWFKIKTWS